MSEISSATVAALPTKLTKRGEFYPSFVVTCAPNFALFMGLRPKSVDTVALRWGVIGHVDDPEHPAAGEYLRIGQAFNAEDRAKLEALQRGLRTRYYEPGALACDDFEDTVRDFHCYLAERLGNHAPIP